VPTPPPTPTPAPPNAVISTTASCAEPGVAIGFDGSGSSGATSFHWDFDDGSSSSAVGPVHAFAAGSYTVILTVTGPGGQDGAARVITVPCA
jgi:PKD repeat protein